MEENRVLLALEALLPLPLRQLLDADRRDVMFLGAIVRGHLIRLLRHVQSVEHHADVGGGHPVLQHRRVVKVGGGRSALQGAEGDSADRTEAVPAGVTMTIGASRLLLVGLGDGGAIRSAVDPTTLRRVELERLPGLAVIHGLVDRDRVRLGGARAELQTDVRQLVLLAEREGEGDVVGRSREALRADERLAAPAGDVVGIVEIGQVTGGEAPSRCAVVAHVAVADAGGAAGLVVDVAVAGGPAGAARGRRFHGRAEGRVYEVGNAASRPVLVVARVAGVLLAGEHLGVDLAAGLLRRQQQQELAEQDRREDGPEGTRASLLLRHVSAPMANVLRERVTLL